MINWPDTLQSLLIRRVYNKEGLAKPIKDGDEIYTIKP